MMAKQQPQQNKEDFTEAEYEKFRSELNLHILHKSYQVGSVAGTATGVVLALFSRKRGFLNTLGTTSLMGTLLGTALINPLVYFGKTSQLDRVGVYDRGYRLHYNENQNRVDQYGMIGAGTGLLLGLVTGLGALKLASLGISAGVGAAAAQNYLVQDAGRDDGQ